MITDSAQGNPEAIDELTKRICIVGVGPVGLGALKVVKDAPQFKDGLWQVTAFEARDKIGGIWYCPRCHRWAIYAD